MFFSLFESNLTDNVDSFIYSIFWFFFQRVQYIKKYHYNYFAELKLNVDAIRLAEFSICFFC